MRRLFVLSIALACSACLRSTTVISVKADGSGTVLQETGMSPQALAMLKGFAGSEGKAEVPAEIFGEAQARKAAGVMGVRFVSGEPIKTAHLEGYRANYAFDDISKVQVNMDQNSAALSSGSEKREPPFGFDFEKRAGSSLLTVRMPEPKQGRNGALGPLGSMPGAGDSKDPQTNQQALAMMKTMMQGLFVDIALAVDGRIVKTNAAHVEGSRVTLLQLDFDKLLADESALQKLQGATDLKALAGVPGLKVATDQKVTIEFAR